LGLFIKDAFRKTKVFGGSNQGSFALESNTLTSDFITDSNKLENTYLMLMMAIIGSALNGGPLALH
jgi:hypothetical protein